MFLQASQILNLPVASLESRAKIGHVSQIIVDYKEVKIVGFLVRQEFWLLSKQLLLADSDVLEIDRNGIVIQNSESLVEPKEVIRIKKLLDKKIKIFRQKACTKSKKRLGKISDFVIEKETGQIAKFHIHGWLEDKIIPRSKLIKITPREIIFEEDVIKATAITQTEEAAA